MKSLRSLGGRHYMQFGIRCFGAISKSLKCHKRKFASKFSVVPARPPLAGTHDGSHLLLFPPHPLQIKDSHLPDSVLK